MDEFIALLDEAPEATVLANWPHIHRGPPSFQLIDGRIEGPEREDDATNEMFANIHVRNLAHALHLDLLVPAQTYYRWTNNVDEPRLARAGTLRASINHRANRMEKGVSVAEGPWLYGLSCDWCYFVSGEEIGRGSDGEPILNVNGLKVPDAIEERRRLMERFYVSNKERLSRIASETGVPAIDIFVLLVAG